MKIYLVEDCKNAPGRILGCFAEEDAATDLALALEESTFAKVRERTLIFGQAPVRGYNP